MSASFSPADWMRLAVRAVRLHDTRVAERDGRRVWVKRRRRGTDPIIALGTLAMKAANGGIVMFARPAMWQEWETTSFRLLHGHERFTCGTTGRRAVWFDELPGQSLRCHAAAGTLTETMLSAAGAELRRAHALNCPITRRPWSHGDPHLGNVLVDAGRARLIDFETRHEASRSTEWRHADDLLILMLELFGLPAEAWPGFFGALLRGFGAGAAVPALLSRLRSARGLEQRLWLARTSRPGMKQLRTALLIAGRIMEDELV